MQVVSMRRPEEHRHFNENARRIHKTLLLSTLRDSRATAEDHVRKDWPARVTYSRKRKYQRGPFS